MRQPPEPDGGKASGFSADADIETASDDYASRFSGAAGRYFLDVQEEIVLRWMRDFPRASVLDVGGGHAQLAVPLVRRGFDVTVTGSDDVCRQRLDRFLPAARFVYRTCDHLRMPFADKQFDVVMAFRLLPHVQQWRQLLAEMCRVARRAVVFDYPDRRSANLFYDALFAVKQKMEGNTRTFLLFSRSEIARELKRNDFEDLRYEPEFFFPMVLHRKLKRPRLSKGLEALSTAFGLRQTFGSPIVVRSSRLDPLRG